MQTKPGLLLPIISAILLMALFSGCDKTSDVTNDDTIYGSGKMATQYVNVDECSGLKIKNIGDVYLVQDTSQSIKVMADDNIMNNVITSAEDGTLLIGLKDGSYSNITFKVYVALKSICHLLIEGAGNISIDNDISCDTMVCNINGAGNITMRGSGNFFDCSINGAGNISAKDFITKKCTSLLNGAGSIIIFVTDELTATVNGAGTITYYGNPPVVHSSITGLGQIIKK